MSRGIIESWDILNQGFKNKVMRNLSRCGNTSIPIIYLYNNKSLLAHCCIFSNNTQSYVCRLMPFDNETGGALYIRHHICPECSIVMMRRSAHMCQIKAQYVTVLVLF